MIYKLKAPFQSGVAGNLVIKNGICKTDDHALVTELTSPPHNFELAGKIDELEEDETEELDDEQSSDAEDSGASENADANIQDSGNTELRPKSRKKAKAVR